MRKKTFVILSTGVSLILLLQLSGLMAGLNERINSALPLVDTPLMNILSAFGGDGFLALFVAFALLGELKGRRVSTKTLSFLLATVVGLLTVATLKVLVGEPRPRPLPGANFLSAGAFPSGHTFRAAIIATYASDRWRKFAPVAWAYAVGIALTRLLLHYHWFSDVLFSLLFAPWLYVLFRLTEGRWLPVVEGLIKRLNLEVEK